MWYLLAYIAGLLTFPVLMMLLFHALKGSQLTSGDTLVGPCSKRVDDDDYVPTADEIRRWVEGR